MPHVAKSVFFANDYRDNITNIRSTIIIFKWMEEKEICFLLVDDHDLVLQGLKRIVESSMPEVKKLVCTAATGSETLRLLETRFFDVLLLDIELPDMSGLDIIDWLREHDVQTKVIVNTMHEELWFIKKILKSGVDGILLKSIHSSKVAEAIRTVLNGGEYFCSYAERVRGMARHEEGVGKNELTTRELDVLKRISEGKNTQEIARELCVSVNTIDTHRRHLLEKMGARNVADLIMTAVSKGIIPIRKC